MAVTLYVERERWLDHLGATWAASPGLIPVVKGNGYGFGRERLARLALDLGAEEIAVGTVHEGRVGDRRPAVTVLTPALGHDLGSPCPPPRCQRSATSPTSRPSPPRASAAGWS